MAGCISCFIIPLILYLFHRFIQPLILKFWNPWESNPKEGEKAALNCLLTGKCERRKSLNLKSEKEDEAENQTKTSSKLESGDTCRLRS